MKSFLHVLPIGACGAALALVALGKLLAALGLSGAEPPFCLLGALLVTLVTTKMCLLPEDVLQELRDPATKAAFAAYFMTLMQLSTFLRTSLAAAAHVLWAAAATGHLVLIASFTLDRIRSFKIEDIYATAFVCYVGILMISVTAPTFGWTGVAQVACCSGFVIYAPLLIIVTIRHLTHKLPEETLPTLCIYAAPPSLALVAYTSCFSQPATDFLAALVTFAQALYVLVLSQIPRMLRTPASPFSAAMTFPLVIVPTALARALCFLECAQEFFLLMHAAVLVETLIACAMTAVACNRLAHLIAMRLRAERDHL